MVSCTRAHTTHTVGARKRDGGRSGVRALVGALVVAGAGLWWAVRRVVVGGRMAPRLDPGDRLAVVRLPRWWPVVPGQLVAVPDPRGNRRGCWSSGSSPWPVRRSRCGATTTTCSTDSRHFGPVERRQVVGRALYRYAPADRTGRL